MNISNEETSTFRLGCELAQTFTRNIKRENNGFQEFVNLSQAERRRPKLLLRNKQIFFDILMKKKSLPKVSRYEMPVKDRISAAAFEHHSNKNTEEVLGLFEKLPATDDVNKVLEFLLNLQNSDLAPTGEVLTTIGDSLDEYGDRAGFYQQFPKSMFDLT